MAQKYMKTSLPSLVIRDVQIQQWWNTISCPSSWHKLLGPYQVLGGNNIRLLKYKLVHVLWEAIWKCAMVHTPWPGIQLLVSLLHVYTSEHTGSLFVIVQKLEQPICLSVRKWLQKLSSIFHLKYSMSNTCSFKFTVSKR